MCFYVRLHILLSIKNQPLQYYKGKSNHLPPSLFPLSTSQSQTLHPNLILILQNSDNSHPSFLSPVSLAQTLHPNLIFSFNSFLYLSSLCSSKASILYKSFVFSKDTLNTTAIVLYSASNFPGYMASLQNAKELLGGVTQ